MKLIDESFIFIYCKDQLTKYPSKTGPGVTWGISGSRQGKNQCKKLKLRI